MFFPTSAKDFTRPFLAPGLIPVLASVLAVAACGGAKSVEDAGGVSPAWTNAYTRAGEPRIVILWYRTFSDQVSDWFAAFARTTTFDIAAGQAADMGETRIQASRGTITGEPSNGPTFNVSADKDGQGSNEAEFEQITVEDDGRRAALQAGTGNVSNYTSINIGGSLSELSMSDRVQFGLEAGFTSTMLSGGTQLLDRATLMRLTDLDQGPPGGGSLPDSQRLETSALVGHANVVIEVEVTHAPDTPLKLVFRIRALDVQSGRILMVLHHGGIPAGERQEFRAVPGGFERAAPRYASAEIGRELALQTMIELAARLD